jgi:plasmid stabilization system protein ParE
MYLVAWSDQAFEQMSRIIRENPARKDELTSALQELAVRLRLNANSTGESRGGFYRVVLVDPLTVFYRLDEESDAVEVIRVRARFRA